jgi:SAM-dependent methyltransferase
VTSERNSLREDDFIRDFFLLREWQKFYNRLVLLHVILRTQGERIAVMKVTTTARGWRGRLRVWALARLDDHCERAVAGRKRALLGSLHGRILEIGPGPGVNLRYYPPDIDWFGIESNLSCDPGIRAEAERRGMRVELRAPSASALDAEDASMDAVVSTFALCTVPDPTRTLAEVLRILRPGGKFVFMEHVGAPDGTALRLLQRASRTYWVRFADGCLPDADTLPLIQAAGFSRVDYAVFSIPVPLISPHVAGVAIR